MGRLRHSDACCVWSRPGICKPTLSYSRSEWPWCCSSCSCHMMLTWIICIPFAAALLTALVPRNYRFVVRVISLAATLLVMLLALKMFWDFDAADVVDGYRFH